MPTPDEIRQARLRAGLTQAQAAELIHVTTRAWKYYEAGQRAMPLAYWELFTLKKTRHR